MSKIGVPEGLCPLQELQGFISCLCQLLGLQVFFGLCLNFTRPCILFWCLLGHLPLDSGLIH